MRIRNTAKTYLKKRATYGCDELAVGAVFPHHEPVPPGLLYDGGGQALHEDGHGSAGVAEPPGVIQHRHVALPDVTSQLGIIVRSAVVPDLGPDPDFYAKRIIEIFKLNIFSVKGIESRDEYFFMKVFDNE
jgi:hypothetical protein